MILKKNIYISFIYYVLVKYYGYNIANKIILCLLIPSNIKYIRLLLVYLNLSSIFITSWFFIRLSNYICDLRGYDKNIKSEKASYILIKINKLFLSLLFWIRIKIDGKIDNTNQVIFTSNHITYLDSFMLYLAFNKMPKCKNKMIVIGIDYLIKIPFLGYILDTIGFIPVKFENKNINEKNKYNKENIKNIYEKSKNYLNDGKSLYMFFEGRRNKTPEKLNDIKYGCYNIQQKTKVPIKFVAIKGINKIWRAYGQPTGYGTVTVKLFDDTYIFNNKEEYKDKINELYSNWIKEY